MIQVGPWQINRELMLSKVFKDPDSDCWLWLGARGPMGGLGGAKKNNRRQMTQSNRLVYMCVHLEDIQDFELVRTCKNKHCVRPEHQELRPNRKRGLNHG